MFEPNPNIFINAYFALIFVSLSSFSLALIKLRKQEYSAAPLQYFFLFFSIGALAWLSLWLKELLFVSMAYSAVVELYVLSSLFLLMAVLNDAGKLRFPVIIIGIHTIVVLGGLFVDSLFQAALYEGFYTLLVYPVIVMVAIRHAAEERDMGYWTIGLASLLAFVVSPLQIYGTLFTDHPGLVHAASIILQPMAFLLAGVGVLVSVLVKQGKRLASLALRDPLTGLYTHHGMVQAMEVPLALLRRSEGYIGAISIDIDVFDSFLGMDAGDTVLVEVARIIRANTRDSDVACHREAGKYVVILPGESVYTELVAERLRNAIEKAAFTHGDHAIDCTASFGVASQSAIKDFAYLLNIADAALQVAQTEGGNCIHQYTE